MKAGAHLAAIAVVGLQLASCTIAERKFYEGDERPDSELVVLQMRMADRDRPTQMVKGAAGLGLFYWGVWQLMLGAVDDKLTHDVGWQEFKTLPGIHVIDARAEQGALGYLGLNAAWRCYSTLSFDFPAGTYEIAFNYDKDDPQFRIENTRTGAVLASAPCTRVGVLSNKPITDKEPKHATPP